MYDWSGKELADNQADTRVSSLSVFLGDAPSAQGNSFETVEIAVDTNENIIVAGNAANSIENNGSTVVAGKPIAGEGASLLTLTNTSRHASTHWVTFVKAGGGPTSCIVVGVAAHTGRYDRSHSWPKREET